MISPERNLAEEDLGVATRQRTGPFTFRLFKQVLEQVHQNDAILTLTVSTGQDERVFYFTRGALLFLAVGASGGEVLARKIVARGLLTEDRGQELDPRAELDAGEQALLELVATPPRTVGELLVTAQASGLPSFRAASLLVDLLQKNAVALERVAAERLREEDAQQAQNIEDALEVFIN